MTCGVTRLVWNNQWLFVDDEAHPYVGKRRLRHANAARSALPLGLSRADELLRLEGVLLAHVLFWRPGAPPGDRAIPCWYGYLDKAPLPPGDGAPGSVFWGFRIVARLPNLPMRYISCLDGLGDVIAISRPSSLINLAIIGREPIAPGTETAA